MSSGRDRDRERDRRNAAAASARTNEYFVPKDGIDREVITADVCRYLGNDALVRPGNYENPQTRQIQQGYFITAYRNLTTAMIADLKADSERWEAERRQTAGRGQPSNVEYRASTTHQSRQYYGPTEAAPAIASQGYATPATPSSGSSNQGVYDQGSYAPSSNYGQPLSGYGAAPSGYSQQDNGNYYVAGANMNVDVPARAPAGQVPRGASSTQYPSYSQGDSRSTYYQAQPQPPPSISSSQYPNPTDPYYGRAPPVTGTYDTPDVYDSRTYPDSGAYSQAQMTAPSTTATSGSSSRPREREREPRDDRRHNRRH